MKYEYIKCKCAEDIDPIVIADHLVVIAKELDDSNLLYIYTGLNHYLPWYKRILPAIKYMLGCDNTHIWYKEMWIDKDTLKTHIDNILKD